MNNNLKVLVSIIVLLAIAAVSFFFYRNNQIKKEVVAIKIVQNSESFDWVETANVNLKAVEAKKQLLQGDYEGAISNYKQAAAETPDIRVRSTLEISAAASLMNLDTGKGAEYYAGIVNNREYPAISRGYALLQISQFYRGNRDVNLLKAFLKEEDFKKMSPYQMENELYRILYDIYPYGIAGARLGLYELKTNPSKENAKKILETYDNAIDKNIEEMVPYVGMRSLIPNTYLAKANLYRELSKYDLVTKEQVKNLYEKSDKEAKSQGSKISEQFGLLRYAEYLAEIGEIDNVEIILKTLTSFSVEPMVKTNLSKVTEAKLDFFNLANLSKNNKTAKEFFAQFSW